MPNWYTINHPTTLHTHNETVTHCCSPMAICAAGCILQAKLPSLDTQPPPGSPRLTILSASSVRTLVHCVVKYSRPPDLKSSSNVSLPFAWITGPRKRTHLSYLVFYSLSNLKVSTYFCFLKPNSDNVTTSIVHVLQGIRKNRQNTNDQNAHYVTYIF